MECENEGRFLGNGRPDPVFVASAFALSSSTVSRVVTEYENENEK